MDRRRQSPDALQPLLSVRQLLQGIQLQERGTNRIVQLLSVPKNLIDWLWKLNSMNSSSKRVPTYLAWNLNDNFDASM